MNDPVRPRFAHSLSWLGLRFAAPFAASFALAASCTCNRSPASTAATSQPVASATNREARSVPLRALSEADVRHLLSRGAFGPAVGEVRALTGSDLDAWLERQLAPTADEPELDAALRPYARVFDAPSELVRHFPKEESALDRRGEEEDPTAVDDMEGTVRASGKEMRVQKGELVHFLQMAELTRHIVSQRQLREVMADFWINHFNVQGSKSQIAVVAPRYLEGIRERALGRFEDLLSFTAHHPAMLLYLDNVRSVALPDRVAERNPFRGLNENYARELLELHTLGVDGGYTQEDVREVARVFTGWSVREPDPNVLEFVFHERRHDTGSKLVLGNRIESGGQAEGDRVLTLLAQHPATARHLATKLCRRFVADDPPPPCVDVVQRAYAASNGDIGATVRALFESPSFWDEGARGSKFKSPLEFLVSAARALGYRPDGSLQLSRQLSRMGEGLMRMPAPTGYPERMEAWLSSGTLHARLELSTVLARGAPAGLEGDPSTLFVGDGDVGRQAEALIVGTASETTRTAVEAALASVERPRLRQMLALALYLGSPEFQRQ